MKLLLFLSETFSEILLVLKGSTQIGNLGVGCVFKFIGKDAENVVIETNTNYKLINVFGANLRFIHCQHIEVPNTKLVSVIREVNNKEKKNLLFEIKHRFHFKNLNYKKRNY